MKKHTPYCVAALVLIITFVVFLPALRNEFVNWDDFDYAYDNYHIRSLSWEFFQWAFTDISFAGFWYPLVWTSHAIDYAVWGLNPLGHHLTSILLHSINSFLVTLLIIKLLQTAATAGALAGSFLLRDDRAILIAAGITGLLFGIHPLHVEPAVWISDRKDLLSALFSLLSVLSYISFVRGLEERKPTDEQQSFYRNKKYLLSLGFFALAISCKTMAITLPVVLLLLDWYPLRRSRSQQSVSSLLVEKLPFLAGSLLITLVSLIGQQAFGAISHLEATRLTVRAVVAGKALMMYLWKMAVPADLIPFYPYPEQVTLLTFEYVFPIVLAGLITTVCLLQVKQRPYLLALWGCYVIAIAPALGIVPVGTHYMADRYAYLPSIGPFLLMGLAAGWGWTRADSSQRFGTLIKGIALSAAVCVSILLMLLTVRQIGVWRNSIVFWNYVIEKEGDHVPVAYNNRGEAFLQAGQPDRAVADHTKAIALKPDYPEYYNNRGVAFMRLGQVGQAMDDFEKAIALDPRFLDTYVNRGLLHRDRGRNDRAFDDLTTAISGNTKRDIAYYVRGLILLESGQMGPAIDDFTSAIALNPYHADAYTNRGLLFAQAGRFDQALSDFEAAISINPSAVEAYNDRGLLFEEMGRFGDAVRDYSRAIDIAPADHLSYSNRGVAYGKMGLVEEAISDHSMALSLKPDSVQAYLDRGELYRATGKADLAVRDFQAACRLGNADGCSAARKRGR